jgi:hypothetical protein
MRGRLFVEADHKYRTNNDEEVMPYMQNVQHGFHCEQASLDGHVHDRPQNERPEQTDKGNEELGHYEPLLSTTQLQHNLAVLFGDVGFAMRKAAPKISECRCSCHCGRITANREVSAARNLPV